VKYLECSARTGTNVKEVFTVHSVLYVKKERERERKRKRKKERKKEERECV
jgi:hypothetical protein